MNTTYASPAENQARDSSPSRALVWDLPVRLFHWLMVFCFAGAYMTAESERWQMVHITLGYTLAGLVGFRLLWGILGTRHARFSNFLRGPRAVVRYLRSLAGGQPEQHLGHNPAGAIAIIGLIGLGLAVTASGWANYSEVGGDWLEEFHEVAANLMLTLVFVHVAGVLVSSWLHRENLVGAMVTGYKTGQPEAGTPSARPLVAALLLAAVLGFWWLQWQSAPTTVEGANAPVAASHDKHRNHHDD